MEDKALPPAKDLAIVVPSHKSHVVHLPEEVIEVHKDEMREKVKTFVLTLVLSLDRLLPHNEGVLGVASEDEQSS